VRTCSNSSYFVQGATPGDQSGIFADVTKLNNSLGMKSFVPVDIGLRKFVEWARKSKFSLTK
jgi:nucleoside-diphosphate-sugar epimerase